ncbi:MAG: histidine kinase, partial [Pseudomonadota bacterium]|nr:histidine kinase [Pseudomonadota bacterium]
GFAMLIICALCALLVTYVLRLESTLWQSFVFSLAIGGSMMLMIRTSYYFLWGEQKPSPIGLAALVALATPLSFMAGSSLASWLLGLPIRDYGLNHLHANAGLVVLTMLAGVFSTWYFWTQARLERLNASTAEIERQASRAHLQMLQAQIEPHMLFNTLANLQGLITLDPPRAQQLLEQLIHYLRATLSSSRAEQTTLAQEFKLIDTYLELMSVRMGRRLTYTLDLPMQLGEIAIAPMILQPLVENAIKHGLEPSIDGGLIEVSAHRHDDQLHLTVRDTGQGIQSVAKEHGSKLGNHNIAERLRVLYGDAAQFSLVPNLPHGAIARVVIPLS